MAEEVGSNIQDGIGDASTSSPGFEVSEEKTVVGEVSEEKRPVVGMKFESLDKVFTFYNRYAKETGFSVRKSKSSYSKSTKEQTQKYYVCSKEGTNKTEVIGESKRRYGIVRMECNAKIVVLKKTDSTVWVISQFVEEHSHLLATPHKVHFLRSHREVSAAKKQLSQQFSEVNIPMCQQISLYEVQAGGVEHMGCTQKDLYNAQRDLRKEMDGHDVELLLEHFMAKQEKNSAFYFKMEVDMDNRLDRCFWADANSRRAYGIYGDVVVFDTTYNTNRYDMKFAPFVGVNKHGQTVVFACAFLNNEKIESFLWLFDQFKKAMPAGPPKMIITDQDAAITNAVSVAFPETFHRFCIWHIQQKFSTKLDANSPDYDYDAFHKCIWNSEMPEEFDSNWAVVVDSMVGDLRLGNAVVGSTSICGEASQSSQQQIFNDPLPVRGKGSGKRLKSGKEKAMEKSVRHCQGCGQSDHDWRKCPMRINDN